jgi:hypothetical protein
MISIIQIVTILVLTAILIWGIVEIAKGKRRVWENLHDGDTVICRRPDGSEIIEYVMAYRPEEGRVCLSKDGWLTKFQFLCGENEYFLVGED